MGQVGKLSNSDVENGFDKVCPFLCCNLAASPPLKTVPFHLLGHGLDKVSCLSGGVLIRESIHPVAVEDLEIYPWLVP